MTAAGTNGAFQALLDHQLIDITGHRCGKVDDVELEWSPENGMRIVSLLSGPGVVEDRMNGRFWKWCASLGGIDRVRIQWHLVHKVNSAVDLSYPASDFGLDRRERRAEAFLERILLLGSADRPRHQFVEPPAKLSEDLPVGPAIRFRLSRIVGMDVVGADGKKVGTVRDVLGPIVGSIGEPACPIQSLALGWTGRLERYGFPVRDVTQVDVARITAMTDDQLVLGRPEQHPRSPG